MSRYWTVNGRARAMAVLAFVAIGTTGCGGGAPEPDSRSALDRKLNLALEQVGTEPEFRDVGPGAAGPSEAAPTSPPPARKPLRLEPPAVRLAAAEVRLAPRAEPRPLLVPEMSSSVPSGTTFQITLSQPLNTEYNFPGDAFMATLSEPLMVGDREVAPAGTEVLGRVTAVRAPSGSQDGVIEARLELSCVLHQPLIVRPITR